MPGSENKSHNPLEQPVIPLRLALIADFSAPGTAAEMCMRRLPIDKDNFSEVLRQLCPRVGFHIDDPLASANSYLKIEFPVKDLRAFHPSSLVREVESLRALLQGRQALADLRDRKISREQFIENARGLKTPWFSGELLQKALRATETAAATQPGLVSPKPVPEPAAGKTDLDAILNLVEIPGETQQSAARKTEGAARVQQFLSEISDTSGSKYSDRTALDILIKDCDKGISEQLNSVLCAPVFRKLESSWRSLRFLVDRTDFREPIRLEVISASKENLIQVLESLLEESGTAEVPLAAVITDFEFTSSMPDMELLKGAAEIAEQLQAPLLVNAGAAFFGKASAQEAATIPVLRSHLESAEFVKWTAFRQSEASRWVGVCFNRFLLRGAYDDLAAGKLPFQFSNRGEGLWGNPSWAIGTLLARSFVRTGWCGHITGMRGGGEIEDLLVHSGRLPSGGETQIPLETIFLKDREDDFFVAGFMVLQSGQNQDKAVLLRAPSAHSPEKYGDASETESSRWRSMLTYQLVAARFIHYLGPMLQNLLPLGNPREIEQGVRQGLGALIAESGAAQMPGLQAGVSIDEERPGSHELRIKIQPGPNIWSLPIFFEFKVHLKLRG